MAELFDADEQKMLEAHAQRRGFATLRGYLWWLIRQEMDQGADDPDDVEPPAEFRREWEDASNRRSMSWEEFLRRLGD